MERGLIVYAQTQHFQTAFFPLQEQQDDILHCKSKTLESHLREIWALKDDQLQQFTNKMRQVIKTTAIIIIMAAWLPL